MSEEFVRISSTEKRYGQTNLLRSQLEMLNIIKIMRSFNELRKSELNLKISLKARMKETNDLIRNLEKILPKVKMKDTFSPYEEPELDESIPSQGSIEEELEKIKRRLAKLQS